MKKLLLPLLFLFLGQHARAVDIAAFTEELPPLNYAAGNQVRGFSSELLKQMAKSAGLKISHEIMPWARAYRHVLETPDTLLYTAVRTTEREPLFYWVGPISQRRVLMYRLADRSDIVIRKESDLLQYRNGAMFESAAARKLAAMGMQPELALDIGRSDEINLKKLLHGRTDLVAMLDWGMAWQLKQAGRPAHLVKSAWVLDDGNQYWFALNRQSSPDKIRKLQAALDKLQANGSVARLRKQYMDD